MDKSEWPSYWKKLFQLIRFLSVGVPVNVKFNLFPSDHAAKLRPSQTCHNSIESAEQTFALSQQYLIYCTDNLFAITILNDVAEHHRID